MKLSECPLCRSKRIRYVACGDYQTRQGTESLMVPEIEYNECLRCSEVYLDDAAMRRVQAFRKSLTRPGRTKVV